MVMVLGYGISTCDHVFEFISTLNPVIAVFHLCCMRCANPPVVQYLYIHIFIIHFYLLFLLPLW